MSDPTLHTSERIAKAALEAARKGLWDCQEQEHEAHIAYLEAMDATTVAIERERDAFSAWCDASRELTLSWRDPRC